MGLLKRLATRPARLRAAALHWLIVRLDRAIRRVVGWTDRHDDGFVLACLVLFFFAAFSVDMAVRYLEALVTAWAFKGVR